MSEPVAWRSYGRMKNDLTGWRFATCSSTYHDDPKQEALYTHPPIKRTLTDEVIADLWHQNGGFHHHFARAVERYLKGEK